MFEAPVQNKTMAHAFLDLMDIKQKLSFDDSVMWNYLNLHKQ